jgi:putative restriction endonuclease
MKFHWVSQNQTGDEEVSGGYMWCPITQKNGKRSPYYEMMRHVQPGDVVFSFRKKLITHIGIVISTAYEAQKPFKKKGDSWLDVGWKVRVEYESVGKTFSPAEHIGLFQEFLSNDYFPLKKGGGGKQMYFATLDDGFAHLLLRLLGFTFEQLRALIASLDPLLSPAKQEIDNKRIEKLKVPETKKLALIEARVGQGTFRRNVLNIEKRCRVTKIEELHFLRASHIKPWSVGSDEERLDGFNGLMLTPTVDHLFDQGFMSFKNDGQIIRVKNVSDLDWSALGIPTDPSFSVGPFCAEQSSYLEYHRDVRLRTDTE